VENRVGKIEPGPPSGWDPTPHAGQAPGLCAREEVCRKYLGPKRFLRFALPLVSPDLILDGLEADSIVPADNCHYRRYDLSV
jgi:hypothetical protein